jgi:hypothetical protein
MFQDLLFLEYVSDNSLDPPVVAISSLLLFKNSSLILAKLRTPLPLSMYMGAGQSDFVREAQCTVDSSALSPMAGSRGKTWLGALSNHAGYDSTIGPGRGASCGKRLACTLSAQPEFSRHFAAMKKRRFFGPGFSGRVLRANHILMNRKVTMLASCIVSFPK